MQKQTSYAFVTAVLGSIAAAAVIGYFFPRPMLAISIIGVWYLNALKLIAVPLVVSILVVGLASLRNRSRLGLITGRTIALFAATSLVAVIVGMALGLASGVGVNKTLGLNPLSYDGVPEVLKSVSGFLESLIPAGLFGGPFGLSLGFAVFSLFLGLAVAALGVKGRSAVTFFTAIRDALLKLLSWVLIAAPLGIGILVGSEVAAGVVEHSIDRLIGSLLPFAIVVLVGLAIQLAIVLPLFLRAYTGRPIVPFLKSMFPALATAFGTASKPATLPVCYTCVVDRIGLDSRAASFVLPLATFLNMNGSALPITVGAIFVTQAFGMSLSILQLVGLGLTSLVVSFAVASAPQQGGLFGIVAVAGILGFTGEALTAISTLVAVEWLLSRFAATVDIAGDSVAVAVISESLAFKTAGASARPERSSRSTGRTGQRTTRSSDGRRGRGDQKSSRAGARSGTRRPTRGRDSVESEGRDRSSRRRQTSTSDREQRPDRRTSSRDAESSGRSSGRSREATGPAIEKPERESVKSPRGERESGGRHSEKANEPVSQSRDRDAKRDAAAAAAADKPEPAIDPALSRAASSEAANLPKAAPDKPAEADRREEQPDRTDSKEDNSRQAVEESEQPISYGRARARKGKPAGGDASDSQPPVGRVKDGDEEEAPPEPETFTNENIDFGRGKRKKVR